jgi:DNA-directed RNA polymerase subunit H (RpoH/RPB5)
MENEGLVEVDHSDTVIGRVWMCSRTLFQMLQDRGYRVEWERDTPTYTDVEQRLRALDLADSEKSQRLLNKQRRTFEHPKSGTISEIFWVCGKVGKNSDVVKDISKALLASPMTNAIVIQIENCTISGPARNEMDPTQSEDNSRLEFFDTGFLLRNIMHHRFQPKWIVLTDSGAQEKKRAYCAKSDQLPALLWEDPVRRYLGLKVDQVVRIKRLSDGGYDIAYRIVQPKQVGKKKK